MNPTNNAARTNHARLEDGQRRASFQAPMHSALPSLESKVAFLSQASSYPEPVHRVECIETHMSWVFLAGNFAYKLKKPVKTEFFDFRLLAARHYYCMAELRLNRRLARAIYIGLVPLVLDGANHLRVGGGISVVDWLVKMHRVPVWLMFDFAIAHRSASHADAARIAATLAQFYRTLPAERMTAPAYRSRLGQQIESNRTQLRDGAYALPRPGSTRCATPSRMHCACWAPCWTRAPRAAHWSKATATCGRNTFACYRRLRSLTALNSRASCACWTRPTRSAISPLSASGWGRRRLATRSPRHIAGIPATSLRRHLFISTRVAGPASAPCSRCGT